MFAPTKDKKIPHKSANAGFTFIETLVAISILVLAVVGPMYLASQGLRAARIARDQINANYLAQEAIEYIRYRRDNNTLKGNWWLTQISTCETQKCMIDVYETEGILLCPSDQKTCPQVMFEESTGKYGHDNGSNFDLLTTWANTKFTREVTVDETIPDQEATVSVTITWKDGVLDRSYTLSEQLLNWQQ